MKFLKKIIVLLFKCILGIVAFVLVYIVLGYSLPYITVNSETNQLKNDSCISVYISSNGVHTDVALPLKLSCKAWTGYCPYTHFKQVDSTYTYISFGIGNKEFYINTPTWNELKLSTAFNAAFGLGQTAMHVTLKKEIKINENCVELKVTPKQLEKIETYIFNSFKKQEDGNFVLINYPGYNENDCFYDATETYNLFKTCNVWTGNALKKAGIKMGVWTPFEKGVLQNLK